ncbi:CD63 antigen-like isoform X1 [Aphidius gifuensis]|uniref:CD63 antigen-like isoform X1 n=1 Tax=Aphidius gifuensis TaxID=684658 RepID=UPI001CDB4E44|nr:CD63 antigen-like isoform X1 [Aphidius gifuensis]
MSCAIGGVRLLLFFFNFILTLCGLGVVIAGVIIRSDFNDYADLKPELASQISMLSTPLIVIGAVIFIIAFFGCCGALRESHFMMNTYAVFLLTVLIIQVAIGVYTFYELENNNKIVEKFYRHEFKNYWNDTKFIDAVQKSLQCCGVESKNDYSQSNWNGTIPASCCSHDKMHENEFCTSNIYQGGCLEPFIDVIKGLIQWAGGLAIGVAVVEFVGVVFALCLANSIKNAERRAYRV